MSKLPFKKLIKKVVFLMLITAPTIVHSQSDSLTRVYQSPCQSEWTKYNTPLEKRSIVRSNLNNHIVYIQEANQVNNVNRHTH